MRISTSIPCAIIIVALMITQLSIAEKRDDASGPRPTYSADGKLIRPEGYHTWIFVGASIGMGYGEKEYDNDGPGEFHNVYITRDAYAAYRRTGRFPEYTMLAMEEYRPATNESINKRGQFEGRRIGLEVAVKDGQRFKEGWAYFSFSNGEKPLHKTATAFPKARCYDCHAQHAAVDNVFTQFYPILRTMKEPTDE